jgi:hypothetical protein
MGSLTQRVRDWAQQQGDAYRKGEDRPLGGYLTFLGVYSGAVAVSGLAIRASGRSVPERVSAGDLALLTVATHRLSRTIAKDPITSPIRAPFTEYEGTAAAGELAEGVRGHGVQHSLGELLACPMCLAQWVATGFSVGLVVAPRTTRFAMSTFTADAGADFLQYFYAYLQQATEK